MIANPHPMRDICYENGPVVGYSTTKHMLLDLDGINACQLYRALRVIENLIGHTSYVICISSIKSIFMIRDSFDRPVFMHDVPRINVHVILEKEMNYPKITYYYDVLAGLGILDEKHVEMRRKRLDVTLRVSPKGVIPPPLPVIYHKHRGDDYNIHAYLSTLDTFRNVHPYAFELTNDFGEVGNFSLLTFVDIAYYLDRFQKIIRQALRIFSQESADLTRALARQHLHVERKRQQQPPTLIR